MTELGVQSYFFILKGGWGDFVLPNLGYLQCATELLGGFFKSKVPLVRKVMEQKKNKDWISIGIIFSIELLDVRTKGKSRLTLIWKIFIRLVYRRLIVHTVKKIEQKIDKKSALFKLPMTRVFPSLHLIISFKKRLIVLVFKAELASVLLIRCSQFQFVVFLSVSLRLRGEVLPLLSWSPWQKKTVLQPTPTV